MAITGPAKLALRSASIGLAAAALGWAPAAVAQTKPGPAVEPAPPGAAADTESDEHRLNWNYPRFRLWQYIASGTVTLTGFYLAVRHRRQFPGRILGQRHPVRRADQERAGRQVPRRAYECPRARRLLLAHPAVLPGRRVDRFAPGHRQAQFRCRATAHLDQLASPGPGIFADTAQPPYCGPRAPIPSRLRKRPG